MASLANSYEGPDQRRNGGAAAAPSRVSTPDPFRLRPLPNEEIYFYRKPIDNSGVVRVADPRARRRCWRELAMMAAICLALAAYFYPALYATDSGYEIDALTQQHARLLAEKLSLEVMEARITSPGRLRQLAPELAFENPTPSQVVFLNPTQEDASLALNSAK